jgi:hypothetical protein
VHLLAYLQFRLFDLQQNFVAPALHDTQHFPLSHHALLIECEKVCKVNEGRPNTVDMIKNDQIQLIINTTEGIKI